MYCTISKIEYPQKYYVKPMFLMFLCGSQFLNHIGA